MLKYSYLFLLFIFLAGCNPGYETKETVDSGTETEVIRSESLADISSLITSSYDDTTRTFTLTLNKDQQNLKLLTEVDPYFQSISYYFSIRIKDDSAAPLLMNEWITFELDSDTSNFPLTYSHTFDTANDYIATLRVSGVHKEGDTSSGKLKTYTFDISIKDPVIPPTVEFATASRDGQKILLAKATATQGLDKVVSAKLLGTCDFPRRYDTVTYDYEFVGKTSAIEDATDNGDGTFSRTFAYYPDYNEFADKSISCTAPQLELSTLTDTVVSNTGDPVKLGHTTINHASATNNRPDGVLVSWNPLSDYNGAYHVFRIPNYYFETGYTKPHLVKAGTPDAPLYQRVTPEEGVTVTEFFDAVDPNNPEFTKAVYVVTRDGLIGSWSITGYPNSMQYIDVDNYHVTEGRLGLNNENYELNYAFDDAGKISFSNLLPWAGINVAYVLKDKMDVIDLSRHGEYALYEYDKSKTSEIINSTVDINDLLQDCPPAVYCDVFIFQTDEAGGKSSIVNTTAYGGPEVSYTVPTIYGEPFYANANTLVSTGSGLSLIFSESERVRSDEWFEIVEGDNNLIGIKLVNTFTQEEFIYSVPIVKDRRVSDEGTTTWPTGTAYYVMRPDKTVLAPNKGIYTWEWGFVYPDFGKFVSMGLKPEKIILTREPYGEGVGAVVSKVFASKGDYADKITVSLGGHEGNGDKTFIIYRSINGSDFTQVALVNKTTTERFGEWVDSDVSSGNTYSYYMDITNTNTITGVSVSTSTPHSDAGFVENKTSNPDLGGDIVVQGDDKTTGSIKIHWNNAADAAFHIVDVFENGIAFDSFKIDELAINHLEIKEGLHPGANYTARITPGNVNGIGLSTDLTNIPYTIAVDLRPTNVTTNTFDIEWNEIIGATYYTVYITEKPYGSDNFLEYKKIGNSTENRIRRIKGTLDSEYQFYLVARFTEGNDYTSDATTYIHAVDLSLNAGSKNNSWDGTPYTQLHWTELSNVNNIKIYRDGNLIQELQGVAIGFNDISVSPGQTYTYTVEINLNNGRTLTLNSASVTANQKIEIIRSTPPSNPRDSSSEDSYNGGNSNTGPGYTIISNIGSTSEGVLTVSNITVNGCDISELNYKYRHYTFFGEFMRYGNISWYAGSDTSSNCLSNASVTLIGYSSGKIVYFDGTVGTVRKSAEGYGWNTAESPSWGSLFRSSPGGSYYDAETAKNIYRNLTQVGIHSVN